MKCTCIQGNKQGLAALQDWKHINCIRPSCRDYVKDPIVQRLLHPVSKSSFGGPVEVDSDEDEESDSDLPPARSTFESMLAKLDTGDDDDRASRVSEDARIVEGLSGGTITFLFERKSNDGEKEAVDVGDD